MNLSDSPVFITRNKAELFWVEQSRNDPAMFITYLTGGHKPPAKHHKVWLYYLLSPHKYINIIAPRESAKTTISEFFIAWFLGNNPWRTNYIVSASASQARSRLRNIRSIIGLERYKMVFPHVHIDSRKTDYDRRSNSQDEFTIWSSYYPKVGAIDYPQWRSIITSQYNPRDATLYATGITSGSVVGRRCSGIALLDDLHDRDNSASEAQRQKVYDAYASEIEGTITEEGKVASISTRWAETDFPGRVKDIISPEGVPLWKTIDIPAINPSGESYWPEFWSLDKLEQKRQAVGDVWFRTMYLNDPYALSSDLFTSESIRKPLPSVLPHFKQILISTDLASSTSKKADFSVAVCMAIDDMSPFNVYVLQVIRGKWGLDGSLSKIAEFYDAMKSTYGPIKYVLFEKQGFQSAAVQRIREINPQLPLELVPLNGSKTDRVKPLAIKAQTGGLFINVDMDVYPLLYSELMGFGNAQHDDIVDALSLPFNTSNWNTHGGTLSSKVSVLTYPVL